MTTQRRTTCKQCNIPIEQPKRGRPREFCEDGCKRKWWKRLNGVFSLDDRAIWLYIPPPHAPRPATRSDDHVEVVGSILDSIEGLLQWSDEDYPDRHDEVRKIVADALGDWAKSLFRGRDARQDDIFDLQMGRLHDLISPMYEDRRRRAAALEQAARDHEAWERQRAAQRLGQVSA